MTEPPGKFTTDWKRCDALCRSCGGSSIVERTWESDDGAFEDHCYRCEECGHTWWVDGPDA